MSVEYFRSDDPMENFVLGVVIQEIVSETEDSAAKVQPKFIRHSLRWQQKLYSPSEIADYVHHKAQSRHTLLNNVSAIDQENRLALSRLERDTRSDLRETLMQNEEIAFFTLVDRDLRRRQNQHNSYHHNNHNNSTNNTGNSGSNAEEVFPMFSAEDCQRQRQRRDGHTQGRRRMALCLATDIRGKQLLAERHLLSHYGNGHATAHNHDQEVSQAEQYERYYEEQLLLHVCVGDDGLIEISPPLSQPIAEPTTNTNTGASNSSSSSSNNNNNHASNMNLLLQSAVRERLCPSVFSDEHSVETALKKGHILQSRRVFCRDSGRVFLVSVFNERAIWSPLLIENRRQDTLLRDALRASLRRPLLPLLPLVHNDNNNYSNAISANNANSNNVAIKKLQMLMVEIIEAQDFDASAVCVAYEISLPRHMQLFNCSSSNNNSKTANTATNNGKNDYYAVCHGYTHIAQNVSRQMRHSTTALSRYMLLCVTGVVCVAGGCVAVAVGVSWLFWVCPVLCLVVTTFVRPSHPKLFHHNNSEQGASENEDGCVATLNHLISLKCLTDAAKNVHNISTTHSSDHRQSNSNSNDAIEEEEDVALLQVSVYGKGAFDRGILLGSACVRLPFTSSKNYDDDRNNNDTHRNVNVVNNTSSPSQLKRSSGEEVLTVSCVALRGGLHSELCRAFLGHCVSLKTQSGVSRSFLGVATQRGRFGSVSETAGSLTIRLSRLSYCEQHNTNNNSNNKNTSNSTSNSNTNSSANIDSINNSPNNNATATTTSKNNSNGTSSAALQQLQSLRREQSQRMSAKLPTNKDAKDSNANTNNNNKNTSNMNPGTGEQRPSVRSILDSLGAASKRPSLANPTNNTAANNNSARPSLISSSNNYNNAAANTVTNNAAADTSIAGVAAGVSPRVPRRPRYHNSNTDNDSEQNDNEEHNKTAADGKTSQEESDGNNSNTETNNNVEPK